MQNSTKYEGHAESHENTPESSVLGIVEIFYKSFYSTGIYFQLQIDLFAFKYGATQQ